MPAKNRILHMIGSLGIGGSQAFVMNIYRKIDRDKLQFDFIVDSPEYTHYISEIESLGGKVYFFPKFNGKNYIKVRRFWTKFLQEHKEYKVLHSHVRSYASLYIPIAKSFGLKTIIHSHNNSNGKGLIALGKRILQYPLRFQSDYYMACSRDAGEWLFGGEICKSNSFQVIKNAIDVDDYIFSKENREMIREEFELEDQFVLGYLARVTMQKNPLFVIEVMNELVKINSSAKLLFVGDGELLPDVKKRIEDLGLENKTIVTGMRTDVKELMSAMDCYILPSFWEGLGISLIEAQASGLQCICSEGIQDEAILSGLVTKYSLDFGAKKWAEKIASMKTNYERLNMSDKIKKAGFDIVENADLLQQFYEKLCEK